LLSLQGFDTLWQVAVLSAEAHVREQARNFLVDIYLNWKLPEKNKSKITETFLQNLDSVFSKLSLK